MAGEFNQQVNAVLSYHVCHTARIETVHCAPLIDVGLEPLCLVIWLDNIRVTSADQSTCEVYIEMCSYVPGDVIVLLVVVLENGLDKVRDGVDKEVRTQIANSDAAVTRARIVPARVGLVLGLKAITPLAMGLVHLVDAEIFQIWKHVLVSLIAKLGNEHTVHGEQAILSSIARVRLHLQALVVAGDGLLNVALVAIQHAEVVVRLHVVGIFTNGGLDGCIGLFQLRLGQYATK